MALGASTMIVCPAPGRISTSGEGMAIPSPLVEILPGAGHTIMVEAPNAMLDALHQVL